MQDEDNPESSTPGEAVESLRSLTAKQHEWRRRYLTLSGSIGALNIAREPSGLLLAAKRMLDLGLSSRHLGLNEMGSLASLARSRSHLDSLKCLPIVGSSATNELQRVIRSNAEMRRHFEQQFWLPGVGESVRLLSDFHRESAVSIGRNDSDLAKFKSIIGSLNRPYLSVLDPSRSLSAIARLQSMGNAIARAGGFDNETSAQLRKELGDWRDEANPPEIATEDVALRVELYISRGLDTDLVDFPEESFEEIAGQTGLRPSPPAIEISFADPFPEAPQDGLLDADSLRIMRETFSTLLQFEMALRAFIDRRMTDHFGQNWHSSGILHPEILSSWQTKKAQAEKEDASLASAPLISFADFTDYERVICKRDIWKHVFEPVFKRPENVRESLYRLNPVRKAVMHARVVGQVDLLYAWAEVNRIMRAIR